VSPTTGRPEERASKGITWSAEAEEEVQKILRSHEAKLRSESLRIAEVNDACVVSAAYTRQAADRLKLRPLPWPVGDVLVPVGLALVTPGIGVFVTVMTAQNSVRLSGWFVAAVIVAALVGMLTVGLGLAFKLHR
jgi:hypothetical protein